MQRRRSGGKSISPRKTRRERFARHAAIGQPYGYPRKSTRVALGPVRDWRAVDATSRGIRVTFFNGRSPVLPGIDVKYKSAMSASVRSAAGQASEQPRREVSEPWKTCRMRVWAVARKLD